MQLTAWTIAHLDDPAVTQPIKKFDLFCRRRSFLSFSHAHPNGFPQERDRLPIEYEAEWAPELVCTFGRRDKFLVPAGFRTPGRPARGLIAIATILGWFKNYVNDKRICKGEVSGHILDVKNNILSVSHFAQSAGIGEVCS